MDKILFTINCFTEAPSIIKNAKLRKYYFLPGAIGIVLLILSIFIAFKVYDLTTINFFTRINNLDFSNLPLGDVINSIVKLLISSSKFILGIVILLIYFFTFKTILIALLSPILSYLSEKIDSNLTNKDFNFSLKDNGRFMLRGIKIGIICLVKQLLGTLLLLILSFIPVIGLITPFLLFLLQGYFTGFAFMDYTLERYKFSTNESMKFIRKKRIYSIICGSIFTLLFFIPILGIFIAPLITCAAVTKLTISLINEDDQYQYHLINDYKNQKA